jgi:hypothetical protein
MRLTHGRGEDSIVPRKRSVLHDVEPEMKPDRMNQNSFRET